MTGLKYYLAAFTAFLIWGFFSLALKPLQAFSSIDILFYRVFFAATALVIVTVLLRRKVWKANKLLFAGLSQRQRKEIIVLTLGGGLLLAANWLFFIYVVNHVSVKAASLAYLVCPIITTVLGFVLLGEKISRIQWYAVALAVLSCLLLSFSSLRDLLFSLGVALTYALYLISQRKSVLIDKLIVLGIQLVANSLLMLPFFLSRAAVVPTEGHFYGYLLLIATVFTIVPLFFNLYALKGLPASTMAIFIYVNPLINFAIAIFYYKEAVNSIQIVSYLLILLSILLFNSKLLQATFKQTIRKETQNTEKPNLL